MAIGLMGWGGWISCIRGGKYERVQECGEERRYNHYAQREAGGEFVACRHGKSEALALVLNNS